METPGVMVPSMVGLETRKILFLGGMHTGKSAIIKHLVTWVFNPEYVSTIEECYHAEFEFQDKKLHLQIYDISGSEEYEVMKEQMMKTADGIVLVYDIRREDTYSEAQRLGEKVQTIRGTENLPLVLVGCMLDLENERVVKKEDGEALAGKLHCPFREISAKDKDSIAEVITLVLQERTQGKEGPEGRKRAANTKGCCKLL